VICNVLEQAVVSNASMWDTIKLLPPGAVPDSYRQQVEQTPANRSFMHLHLGFDAAGISLALHTASGEQNRWKWASPPIICLCSSK
jgi:hypothetical protein